MIIVMDKGHVKWVGSPTDFSLSSYSALSPLNEFDTIAHIQVQECSMDACQEVKQKLLTEENTACHSSEEAQEIIEAEARKEGRVELTVYK